MSDHLFLIVEDHPTMAEMIAKSLKQLEPDAYCVTATNIKQAQERLKLEMPELITVDLTFKDKRGKNSGQPGLDFLLTLFQEYPYLDILVYSTEPSLLKPIIKTAQAHLGGFVVVDKQSPPKDFLNQARLLLDNKGIKLIPSELKQELDTVQMTERELQILELACQNCLTDSSIADSLLISRRAVQSSMKNIREKLKIISNKSEKDMRVLMCNKAKEERLI